MLDDTQFAEPLKEAEKALKPFVGVDGAIAFVAVHSCETPRGCFMRRPGAARAVPL
jgi:hypothetical protein